MKTVDFHTHLLSSEVSFNRFYDKLAIRFFAKKLGIKPKELIENPYSAYKKTITNLVRESKYLDKIVLFGVDAKVDDKGKVTHRDKTVCATNEDLLELYNDNKDIIVPFFSINPKRPDALDLVDKYVELGFKGAKFLQNYWNVNTKDERYIPYFEKLKKYNIPLIIHVGSESSIKSYPECENISMLDIPVQIGVKTVCAHMAIDYDLKKFYSIFSKNPKSFNKGYFTALEMLEKYDNLYADISAILTPMRAKTLPHLSKQTQIHDKLLFATDYPVPFTSVLNSYDISYKRRFELLKISNPFDRYAETILEYFEKDSPIFTNYKKILDL